MKTNLLGILLALMAFDAGAIGRFADIQILDRNTGAVLSAYRYRGEYWVAGTPGDRYSISIRNHRGDRLLAVTTVDGINVVSGETGAWNQRGYVYGAGEGYNIDGWRKSDQEIAAFEFTASPNSYAERTGRPANVGVIGIALFLERPAPPPVTSIAPQTENSRAATGRDGIAAPAAPAARLGTGHGEREASIAYTTQFERLSDTPNEVIRIRYDSWDNLVAMGVVPARRPPVTGPNPFPDSAVSQFVPDPPGTVTSGRR
jgi:hypothetical protein